MNEIHCPHCHQAFKVDEAGYADIVKQIRDREFEKQLNEIRSAAAEKDKALQVLKAKLNEMEVLQKLAISEAVKNVERDRDAFKSGLEHAKLEKELAEKGLKERYEIQIKDREEQIERLRDMKAKLSTKMVGESLESHCETEFNRIRATAFQSAYFEKDNDASSGSKGDYIFKDKHTDGTEIVSIMFEMKNESDTTATKKKNEDFLSYCGKFGESVF